jgi:beta-glucosidase
MPTKAIHSFPSGFLWGTASAAHQNEGDNDNDWSRWERQPGHVWNDLPSGTACEWWAGRYEEDFDRAAAMHNNSLRFSVEWSRIEPRPGQFDEAAIDRYREMLRALRERGLTPMVTLHHFTNPLWFADQGEWRHPDAPALFARYVEYTVARLKGYCSLWCTINEPMVYATQGYSFGSWPPGTQSRAGVTQVAIQLVKAHARAYHAIKALQPESQVGYATHHLGLEPAAPRWLNRQAARLVDHFFNQMFLLALRDGVLSPGGRAIPIPEAKGTLDWIGLQYYQVFKVGFTPFSPASFFLRQSIPTEGLIGPPPWGGVRPEAIFDHLKWLDKTLNHLPIYITECGVPDPDDKLRPEYLIKTVRAVWKAVNFNFPIKGLFFWTLVDNFEWDKGYNPAFNFGLYHLDRATQIRTPRKSAELFAAISKHNGLSSEMVEKYAPHLLETYFPGEQGADHVTLSAPPPYVLSDSKRSTKG